MAYYHHHCEVDGEMVLRPNVFQSVHDQPFKAQGRRLGGSLVSRTHNQPIGRGFHRVDVVLVVLFAGAGICMVFIHPNLQNNTQPPDFIRIASFALAAAAVCALARAIGWICGITDVRNGYYIDPA